MQEIRQCYTSKHNETRYTHANLLMITDGFGKWHYVAIKSISGLLRGITSTHNGDFYCLNCFHLYRTHKKLKEHEQLCGKYDFCNLKLPDEKHKYISSTSGTNTLKILLLYMLISNVYFLTWTHVKILIITHLQCINHYIYRQIFLYLPVILLINRKISKYAIVVRTVCKNSHCI